MNTIAASRIDPDHAGNIAAAHIGLHHDTALAILAADLVGTVDNADIRDAGERYELTQA